MRALECKLTRVIRYAKTAVHWAVERGQSEIIEALVKIKADVNIPVINIRERCACLAADGL